MHVGRVSYSGSCIYVSACRLVNMQNYLKIYEMETLVTTEGSRMHIG